MTDQDNRPMDPANLRQKAEALAREQAAWTLEDSASLSPGEIRKTLHELRVHQIELTMQNEELRTAQETIEAGRDRYYDLYDLAPVGYCTLSEKGMILEANLTVATLLGTARGTLVKQPISRFILKEDQDIYYLHRKQLFETSKPQECELRLVKPDGAFIWAHLTATAAQAEDGAPICRVVISDITMRKRMEEELRQGKAELDQRVKERTKELQASKEELTHSHEVLRALLSRIEQTREEEMARIARDMHDDLGQNLTAIKMDMRWVERATEGSGTVVDIGAIHARATAAIEMVNATVATMQELAASLRPGVLDSLGLVAAIRSEIRRFQTRSGIECRTSLPETLPVFPIEATMAIFRIFQECLTNVARHSGATCADISLVVKDGDIVLNVHDNGKGIAPEVLDAPDSLGLFGMKERATALGGEILFQREQRHGTLVTVRVPNR